MPINKPNAQKTVQKPGLEARRAAVQIMTAATDGGRLMAEVLDDITANLPPAEKARAQRLASEALRWSQRSDKLLGPFLRNKPEDPVLNTLRLAIWEIFGASTQAHGVVDGAVALTRDHAPRKAGMVNAVLRGIIRSEPHWDELPIPSLPKWLRKRLLPVYGKSDVAAIEAAHARGAPLDLTPKTSSEDVARAVGGKVLPTGSVRLHNAGQVSTLPGYAEGVWWVQDAAAALPVQILNPRQGDRVLDLCAAPGGKTLQLAALGARVTALDMSQTRMLRLAENLERTGLPAEVVIADAMTWEPESSFDAILLDAPCSATGTIRRHPDLPHAKAGLALETLCDTQARLLDRALHFLKPRGVLVYCTCSLLPEEGEAQVKAAIARHPDLIVEEPRLQGIDPNWQTPEGGLRLRPDYWSDLGGMDGFYIARLQKVGDDVKSSMTPAKA